MAFWSVAVGIGRKMLLLCCSNSGQLAYALICELYFKFIYLSSILNLEMAQFLKHFSRFYITYIAQLMGLWAQEFGKTEPKWQFIGKK